MIRIQICVYLDETMDIERWKPAQAALDDSVPAVFAACPGCPECEFQIQGCQSSRPVTSVIFWGMADIPETVPITSVFRKIGNTVQQHFSDRKIEVKDIDFGLLRLSAEAGEALH